MAGVWVCVWGYEGAEEGGQLGKALTVCQDQMWDFSGFEVMPSRARSPFFFLY